MFVAASVAIFGESSKRARTAYLLGSVHSLALAAKSVAIGSGSPIASRNFAARWAVVVVVVASFIRGLVSLVNRVVGSHESPPTGALYIGLCMLLSHVPNLVPGVCYDALTATLRVLIATV